MSVNIGAIKHRTNGLAGNERKEWFELIFRPPFMQSETFSVHKNSDKKNQNEPDYNIWNNYNRKGESFRGVKIGGIWKKQSKDKKTDYLSGTIESPAFIGGKINFSLFETKKYENEDASKIDWIYDVIYQPPRDNESRDNYVEPTSYTTGSNGRAIPVYNETLQSNNASISQEEANMYM